MDTLKLLGVETSEDLKFIEEADLHTVLRPIQARELISYWKQTSKCILTTHIVF